MKALHAISIMICFLITCSCDKIEDSRIPRNHPVYLELYLDAEDRDLVPMSAYKFFTINNINISSQRVGYAGVLVYHGVDGNYYAFDMACPHEASRNSIIQMSDDGIYAVCPTCKSKYDISHGIGNPVEGPSRFTLRRYSVSRVGNKLYVRN
jgi:Ferredoxin subunits of nitrite reductase and ring-hydroxylating dioxygenases